MDNQVFTYEHIAMCSTLWRQEGDHEKADNLAAIAAYLFLTNKVLKGPSYSVNINFYV